MKVLSGYSLLRNGSAGLLDQEKAVFIDDGERRIQAAEPPKHPLNKCIASISLLAYIIVSKFCDGLPLYGLETILKRYGGDITRTSMANWVIRLATELQPLVNLLRDQQLAYDYLQIDDKCAGSTFGQLQLAA